MAKAEKVDDGAVDQTERRVFALRKPIAGGDLKELTVEEPSYGHVCRAVREFPNSASSQTIHMIAALSGQTFDVISQLFIKDARDIETWFNSLDIAAVFGDKGHYEPDAYEATFRLSVPVATDKRPITEITVRAPDLGSTIAAEKFKTNEERTAALISSLCDETMQVIYRLKRRDVARIEAWLGPLVSESSSEADELGEA